MPFDSMCTQFWLLKIEKKRREERKEKTKESKSDEKKKRKGKAGKRKKRKGMSATRKEEWSPRKDGYRDRARSSINPAFFPTSLLKTHSVRASN